ncbi:MAG: hypothetical protein WDO15_17510 [Bacteroidota bacterium]
MQTIHLLFCKATRPTVVISQLYSLNGGKFAAARFNFGDNYIMPQTALPTSGAPTSIVDYGGLNFPELIPDAPVTIINTQINATDRIIFGSNTRGKQIALFGYNPTDGTFIGSKYIGFSNSFELASLTPTTDKGLLVLGTTYIAGRFPGSAFSSYRQMLSGIHSNNAEYPGEG